MPKRSTREVDMLKWAGILFTLVLFSGLFVQACSRDEGKEYGRSGQESGQAVNVSGEEAGKTAGYTETERTDFEKTSEKKLEEFRARLEELRARAEAGGREFAKQHQEELDRLEKQIRDVQAKLEELKKSSMEAWGHLREGFDKAAKDMDDAMDKAGKEFEK